MTEYRCTRCGRQLAHSGYSSCPHCGVRFSGVTYGGTRTYSGSGGSGGSAPQSSPEESKLLGCAAVALLVIGAVVYVLHKEGAWPFKKDADPQPVPVAVAPEPPAGQPKQPGPETANRFVATTTGLSFTPAFAQPPAPGSRLAFVYRATHAGGAPLDDTVLRDIMIEARYEAVAPLPGQYPNATVFLGRRRIPLRPVEDDATGTILLQSTLPPGGGAGPSGGAPKVDDPGWLVVCASKFHDGIRDGRPIVVDFPWARAAAGGPPAAEPPRFAISAGVAEFLPPKEGLSYRFSQLLTPVCSYPER